MLYSGDALRIYFDGGFVHSFLCKHMTVVPSHSLSCLFVVVWNYEIMHNHQHSYKHMSNRQIYCNINLVCFALAFPRLHNTFITGRPYTDTPFVIPPGILKFSQPIGDDPNLRMALNLTYNFVSYFWHVSWEPTRYWQVDDDPQC